eukprot:8600319-Lingulodinium_polyedra.AAC.1
MLRPQLGLHLPSAQLPEGWQEVGPHVMDANGVPRHAQSQCRATRSTQAHTKARDLHRSCKT